jgi:cysteine-rich repeat protein
MCACKGGGDLCGNGKLDAGEACDDGNKDDTDGCLSWCKKATCGDGQLYKGVEQCDDGNSKNEDGCTSQCKKATCGDGFVQKGVEACDDGNNKDGDGCSATCKIVTKQVVALHGYNWHLASKGANCKTTCQGKGLTCVDLVQINYIEKSCNPKDAVCPNFFPGLPCNTDGDGPRVTYNGNTPSSCKYRNWNYPGMTCTYSAGASTAHMCACK